tara:strand:- start:60 stop:296 length:237 start_codon:yes stop_codon:yes gene_type:complete
MEDNFNQYEWFRKQRLSEGDKDSVLNKYDRDMEKIQSNIIDTFVKDLYDNGMPYDNDEFIQEVLDKVKISINKFTNKI